MKLEISLQDAIAPQLLQITKSEIPFVEPEGGFDLRRVRYEEIHGIQEKDFDELVKIVEPIDRDIILDAGSGYGSVSRELLKRCPSVNFDLILYDMHEVQLERAIVDLSTVIQPEKLRDRIKLVHGDVRHLDLSDNSIDKIVAKMIIHEIPQHEQTYVLREFYRVLKPGGKLIIWEANLDSHTQKFFQDAIRIKDVLASFNHLVKTRYFLREDELRSHSSAASFNDFKNCHSFVYTLDTGKRLNAELKGDFHKLATWNDLIRMEAKKLPSEVLDKLNFVDNQETIQFEIEKAIFSCYK